MPGFSLIVDFYRDLKNEESVIIKTLHSMLHFDNYESNILLKDESYILGCTYYDGYPISFFENDAIAVYLEGKIYLPNGVATDTQLSKLAEIVIGAGENPEGTIAKWSLDNDGDFIIFMLDKKKHKITILNDAFGRLPVYFSRSHKRLLLSRETRFISMLNVENLQPDKMGIAQYLLFGYPLGRRTLLENVFRLEPSSMITIDFRETLINITNFHQFNFDLKRHIKSSVNDNARNLSELFGQSCKNRMAVEDDYRNVLSLSGGLDSRSVGAALARTDNIFYCVTMLDSKKTFQKDVLAAEQLAKIFDAQWKLFELTPPSGSDALNLLRMKNGLNPLVMRFILSFLKQIREIFGPHIVLFTGDGGDKALPDLRPSLKLRNIDKLVNYIISLNHIFSLDDIVKLMKLKKTDVIDELRNHILSYPEKDMDQKYIHFLIYERAFKWLYEGEDRNRFYFWSVAPFWSLPFFEYAMNCSDEQKSKYSLPQLSFEYIFRGNSGSKCELEHSNYIK
jgi:asparagine synthase (glutamine-hydrolysing)